MSFHNIMKAAAVLSFVSGVALVTNGAMAKDTSATHTISLNTVSDPKDTLTKTKIMDAKGNSVGSVDEVMLDKMGKPTTLKVDVGGFLGVGDKDVAMKASAFKFDPDRKVLITNMTKNQIKALPEVKS